MIKCLPRLRTTLALPCQIPPQKVHTSALQRKMGKNPDVFPFAYLRIKVLRTKRETLNTARRTKIVGSLSSTNTNNSNNCTFLASSNSWIVFCRCFFSFCSCVWSSSNSRRAPLCSWNLNTSIMQSNFKIDVRWVHKFTTRHTLYSYTKIRLFRKSLGTKENLVRL